jgi:hypothetical protein
LMWVTFVFNPLLKIPIENERGLHYRFFLEILVWVVILFCVCFL